ncbi:hypothetical protein [Neobacillus niacini]|uniref:hypothetical protein n=1 Tax=Neobacillus niacini TaxID=86668 RepID=UPI0005EE5A9C|nr:hypothetical protein [Neobacillus niacini]
MNTEIDLFQLAQDYANTRHNGHLTIMKLSGNWRACFGTPGSENIREDFSKMVEGKTLEACLLKLLKDPVKF